MAMGTRFPQTRGAENQKLLIMWAEYPQSGAEGMEIGMEELQALGVATAVQGSSSVLDYHVHVKCPTACATDASTILKKIMP